MTEAQKQFEEWFDEYSDKNDIRLAINYGAYDIAGDAWQHKQQRIDELEEENSELKFQCASNDLHAATLLERIDELEKKLNAAMICIDYAKNVAINEGLGELLDVTNLALKQIEVK